MNSRSKALVGIVSVLLIVGLLSELAKAQSTASQISKVAETQATIDALMSEIKDNSDANNGQILLSTSDPVFGCATDYSTWNTSATPSMEHPWSNLTLAAMGTTQMFMDFNGDGLPDYFYYVAGSAPTTCLYLNNGTGFDQTYRCRKYNNIYYGDCAASS
jgi:hypothetical protein